MGSDDVEWCREQFRNLSDLVFTMDSTSRFAYERQPTYDLAVLSLCDHSILRLVGFVFVFIKNLELICPICFGLSYGFNECVDLPSAVLSLCDHSILRLDISVFGCNLDLIIY